MRSFLGTMRAYDNERLLQAHQSTIAAQAAEIAATHRIVESKDLVIQANEATMRAKDAEIETLRNLVRHLELTVARIRHPAYPNNG